VTPDQWETAGRYAGLVALGLGAAYKAHRAEMEAKKAKQFSAPTGNGFAQNVKDSLACLQTSAEAQKNATERIELRQSQDSTMLYDHIKAHANADVLKGVHRESPSDPNSP
jgi:hypothetical protein